MAFVVTSGQLAAIENAQNLYPTPWAPRSVTMNPSLALTYEQLWRTQPAVRTVTSFLARNIAQLSVDPYRRLSPTDREKATDHPLAALLDRPVPGTKWTKYRLLNTTMLDLCIFDTAYWVKMRNDDGLTGLQPCPPRLLEPQGKNPFAPDNYLLKGRNGKRELGTDEVVHFHGYNPHDPRSGVAPIEMLRQVLAEDHAATVYREQMWRNGARIAGYIKRPKDAPRWSDDARERFRADWRAQYTGDGPATGGTPVLEDGMEFSPAAVTPKDAQYVESRKLTREEVCVAYHVPPVMLGLMEGATFSNVRELHTMLYQDTLAPWLTQLAQDIERQVLEDIDPAAVQTGSVYVEFNIKGKLSGSFEEQARALQSAVGGPWMTRDEARAMHNLRHIDGADELIVPLNVITGGLASPNDTAPGDPSNAESNGQLPKAGDVLRRYFARQGKAITSRLGAGETDPVALLDGDRWDAELAADLRKAKALEHVAVSDDDEIAVAFAINAKTLRDLRGALDAPDPVKAAADLFAGYVSGRADELARRWEDTR